MTFRSLTLPSARTRVLGPVDTLAGYLATDDHRAFLSDPDRVGRLADVVAEHAEARGVQALSWDVFDTALIREPRSEGRRFHIMGAAYAERMAAAGAGHGFTHVDALLARAEAARAAYRMARPQHGNREGTLSEIARIACALLRCPDRADDYVENELEVETASLTANPLLTELARRLPGVRMIFVSDMYIEGPRIRRLVEAKFPDLEIAALHSSADGLGSKRGGGIFANVEAETGIPGAAILHLGDSLQSDFRMPRKSGWNSLYLPLPEAEREARKACFAGLCDEMAAHGITLRTYLHFNI